MTLVLEADLHILYERYMNRMKNCCKRLTVLWRSQHGKWKQWGLTWQRSAVLFLMWKRSIRDSQKSKGACGWTAGLLSGLCEYRSDRTDFGIIRSVIRRKWNRSQAIYQEEAACGAWAAVSSALKWIRIQSCKILRWILQLFAYIIKVTEKCKNGKGVEKYA